MVMGEVEETAVEQMVTVDRLATTNRKPTEGSPMRSKGFRRR